MIHEYGKFIGGMAIGNQKVFSGENPWKPSEPESTATLWRYMTFAKFCSLLDRKALFFSLIGDMEDRYEGFIYPPAPRQYGDKLQQAESRSHDLLSAIARTALVSCWTESDHESSLMWKAYAGAEGVVVRSSFQNLLPPHAAPRFAQVVKSVIDDSPVRSRVIRSAIESPPHESNRGDTG